MTKIVIDEEELERLISLYVSRDTRYDLLDAMENSLHKLKWIPCSERRPDQNTNVMVKDEFNTIRSDNFLSTYFKSNVFLSNPKITHWMPLDFLEDVK